MKLNRIFLKLIAVLTVLTVVNINTDMIKSVIQEKKQECDEDYLPTELRQVAVGFRLEMLELAYMCYKSASQCVDEESEEWLTDYMMGKCLEKMHKAPKEYLNFYRQVSCYFQFLITLYKLNTDISEGDGSLSCSSFNYFQTCTSKFFSRTC